jgi:hypothetical protein
MSHPAIATMSREERAQLLGVSVEAFDEIRAAAMKVGRSCKASSTREAAADAKLFSLRQAARKLGMSTKTLKGHADDGEIRYINTARGKKHRRMMFTEADIEEFIERRARREVPCLSIATRKAHSTTSISKSKVIAFTALQDARASAKLKPSNGRNETGRNSKPN